MSSWVGSVHAPPLLWKPSPLLPPHPSWWVTAVSVALFQAGHNFYNVDLSYVKKLCGTFLGGPKLPQRSVLAPGEGAV